MPKPTYFFLLFFTLYFINSSFAYKETVLLTVVNEQDSLELIKFRDSLCKTNCLLNWGAGLPMNGWDGIMINEEGRVTNIAIDGDTLGPFDGELIDVDLPFLLKLRIEDASLDTIPDFTKLPLLESINLKRCTLSGEVPELRNCNNLTEISFPENELTGTIPSFDHLTLLHTIGLNNNLLEGEIPPFNQFAYGRELVTVRLGNNKLEGAVPNISGFTKLRRFEIQNNQLSILPLITNVPLLLDESTVGIRLANNYFSFDDIQPNLGLFTRQDMITTSWFSPQKTRFLGAIEINRCESYTVNLGIDEEELENEYVWRQDDNILDTVYQNHYTFYDLDLSTITNYNCTVTNEEVPELILQFSLDLTPNPNSPCSSATCPNTDLAITIDKMGICDTDVINIDIMNPDDLFNYQLYAQGVPFPHTTSFQEAVFSIESGPISNSNYFTIKATGLEVDNENCVIPLRDSFDIQVSKVALLEKEIKKPASESDDGLIELEIINGFSPYIINYTPNGRELMIEDTILRLENLSSNQYNINVIDNFGCTDTIFVPLILEEFNERNFIISTNPSNPKKVLFADLTDFQLAKSKFKVFNRDKGLIWESAPFAGEWDGKIAGQLSIGTYYYLLFLENNPQPSFWGYITIHKPQR